MRASTRIRRPFLWIPLILSFCASIAAVQLADGVVAPQRASAQAGGEEGSRLFRAKCASCHGPDGRGHTKQGEKMAIPDMTQAAWHTAHTDAQIRTSINNGLDREKNGTRQKMAAFRTKLRPEQVNQLIALIRGFRH